MDASESSTRTRRGSPSPVQSTVYWFVFFFNDTATTEIYTLSLHDALPIWSVTQPARGDLAGDPDHLAADGVELRLRSGLDALRRHGPIAHRVAHLLGEPPRPERSEEHTSELQSHVNLVCRLLLEKKNKKI